MKCPERPRSLEELDFRRRPMVRWLDPRELADAALRVALSAAFGAYADKRELLAIQPTDTYDYDRDAPLWLDYAADLGDGFDATYAVARTLAQPHVPLEWDGESHATERGRVLLLGGDQVYPSAKRKEYEDRFIGPYRAALPCSPEGAEPHVFAIPGNHDWYDGLTNFLRIFGQDQWIGGWRTRQTRSYFALRLPGRWWLFGIDIQFDTYIDKPQLDYFLAAAEAMSDGDRVILLTGKPSWIKVPPDGPIPHSYANIQYFEEKVIAAHGGRLAVTISGDLHHYCRYEAPGEGHKITSGCGGAYLFPTHHMPDSLRLPGGRTAERVEWTRKAVYPDRGTSRRLRYGALRLPIQTPGLARAMAAVYALLALAILGAVKDAEGSVRESADRKSFLELWPDSVGPASVLVWLLLLAALAVFASTPAPEASVGTLGQRARQRVVRVLLGKVAVGSAHTLLHLAIAWPLTLLALELVAEAELSHFWTLAACLALVALAGRVGGALAFALYLVAADVVLGRRAPKNANYVFACQGISGYKGFLRMRLDPDGTLTVYPVGIDSVPSRWRAEPEGAAEESWLAPADGPIVARLVERPFTVA